MNIRYNVALTCEKFNFTRNFLKRNGSLNKFNRTAVY